MIPRTAAVLLLLARAGFPCAAGGQDRTVTLGKPTATHPHEFSQLRAVRELADGRLIAADWIEEEVLGLDLTTGREVRIGRAGRGPEEYHLPANLLPMPGDSTLLQDEGNGRLAVIGPDLAIHRSFAATPPGAGFMAYPRAVDRQGRLYYGVPAWAAAAPGQPPADSIDLARWDLRRGTTEVLARVLIAPTPRGPAMEPRVPYMMFAPVDAWTATSEGAVLIARAGDYHVERIQPGASPAKGPSYAGSSRPVTAGDRRAAVRRFLEVSPTSGRGPDGGLGHTPPPTDAEVDGMVRASLFAERHPPFAAGAPLLVGAEIWVLQSVPTGAAAAYDVFNGAGRRLGTVQLPQGRRVVGVGTRLYLAKADDNGLERLEVYAAPRLAAR